MIAGHLVRTHKAHFLTTDDGSNYVARTTRPTHTERRTTELFASRAAIRNSLIGKYDCVKLNPSIARKISKFSASLLLALYGLVFLAVGNPNLVVKAIFSAIGLFYFVASFGILKNRLWGFYISILCSITGGLIGLLRISQVLAASGMVDQGALYIFLLPSALICASSIWMAVRNRRLKIGRAIELSTRRRRFLQYAVATAILAAVAVLGLELFNPPKPRPSEIISVTSSTSTTTHESSTSTSTTTSTSESQTSTQTSSQTQQVKEVDVGILQVPVNFDGQLSPGEYDKDTIDYPFTPLGTSLEGHLHVKNDGTWTFFGLEFLGDQETNKPWPRACGIWFDTQNSGTLGGQNTPGVYEFNIIFSDPKNPVEREDATHSGTPFMNAFVRGSDYDWKYYFGPTQLEIKIKTEILKRYFREIGMAATFVDNNHGYLTIGDPQKTWTPMKYEDIALPEPSDALLVGSLVSAVAVSSNLHNRKMSRRALLDR